MLGNPNPSVRTPTLYCAPAVKERARLAGALVGEALHRVPAWQGRNPAVRSAPKPGWRLPAGTVGARCRGTRGWPCVLPGQACCAHWAAGT